MALTITGKNSRGTVTGGYHLQVQSGAKRPITGTGHDNNPDLSVFLDNLRRLVKPQKDLLVKSIQCLGSVEQHCGNSIFNIQSNNVLICHLSPLS